MLNLKNTIRLTLVAASALFFTGMMLTRRKEKQEEEAAPVQGVEPVGRPFGFRLELPDASQYEVLGQPVRPMQRADFPLIKQLSFEIRDPQWADPGETTRYLRLTDPFYSLLYMEEPDRLEWASPRFSFLVDHPLRRPWLFQVESLEGHGFTVGELAKIVAGIYRLIYQVEERTSDIRASQQENRASQGERPQSHGPFGIFGYGLNELGFFGIEFREIAEGKALAFLNIDP